MRTHAHLGVRDLDKSVEFYRALLDAEPAKRFDDYALFLTNEPALELALTPDSDAGGSESAHYGVAVESVEVVDAAIARLRSAGVPVDIERDQDCCYAKQTKVWASDPDGRRWEIYTVHEELERAPACC